MKNVFSYHTRPARPLWKGFVYEGLRLACVVMTLAAVVGISAWLGGAV